MDQQTLEKLLAQKDKLTERIDLLVECQRNPKTRAGVTMIIQKTIAGVKVEHNRFLSFFTTETIPPELNTFIDSYLQRLIGERLQIWAQLNAIGHVA
jgi:hypothetical protein